MKEKIYTIPVSEAFEVDCECPMCLLEKRFEDEKLEYILGPSLMEPDTRVETNKSGFCRRHYEMLYKKQDSRLGLALILDTHIAEQNSKLEKICRGIRGNSKESQPGNILDSGVHNDIRQRGNQQAGDMSVWKRIFSADESQNTEKLSERLIGYLNGLEKDCLICSGLEYTMQRYIDVILYLWAKETDFRNTFNSKKGFCLRHYGDLLAGAGKYLKGTQANEFRRELIVMQLDNMDRIQKEVNWFTKKFDYNNNDAPWGNSKDAVPRSIQKLAGWMSL